MFLENLNLSPNMSILGIIFYISCFILVYGVIGHFMAGLIWNIIKPYVILPRNKTARFICFEIIAIIGWIPLFIIIAPIVILYAAGVFFQETFAEI